MRKASAVEVQQLPEAGKGHFGVVPPSEDSIRVVEKSVEKPKASETGTATETEDVRCQFMRVTPELASAWLTSNLKNRKLREEVVKSYARDMINGNWVITHQGVAFNDQNELIDGQHRLNAIVESGVPILMLVTTGLPTNLLGKKLTTMDAVDRGSVRTIGDQLAVQHDLKDGNLVTGVCVAIARLCTDNKVRKLSVSQVLEVFALYKDSVAFVVTHRSKVGGLRTAGVLGAVALAYAVAPDKIGPLFLKMNSGEDLGAENPILHLRNFLISSHAVKIKGSMRTKVPEITLQAYYCALVGKPAGNLRIDRAATEGLNYFREQQADSVEAIASIFALPKKA